MILALFLLAQRGLLWRHDATAKLTLDFALERLGAIANRWFTQLRAEGREDVQVEGALSGRAAM